MIIDMFEVKIYIIKLAMELSILQDSNLLANLSSLWLLRKIKAIVSSRT